MEEVVVIPAMSDEGLDSQCSYHFGGAPFFVFVTLRDGEIAEVRSLLNPGHGDLGCLGPVMFIKSNGGNKLIVLGIGARPLAGFYQEGIEVFRGVEGTVGDNVCAYLESRLEKVSGATCGGRKKFER